LLRRSFSAFYGFIEFFVALNVLPNIFAFQLSSFPGNSAQGGIVGNRSVSLRGKN
jgi:hypothetical protein